MARRAAESAKVSSLLLSAALDSVSLQLLSLLPEWPLTEGLEPPGLGVSGVLAVLAVLPVSRLPAVLGLPGVGVGRTPRVAASPPPRSSGGRESFLK